MKTFKFSLVLRTGENTDVFISLDDNIYVIHSKRINILYILSCYGSYVQLIILTVNIQEPQLHTILVLKFEQFTT